MTTKGIEYLFTSKTWKHRGPGSWHFVSLPIDISTEIREILKSEEQGWGRLKATVKIGNTEWATAIWFDTKHKTYLLPFKSEIRKKENLKEEQEITVYIWI